MAGAWGYELLVDAAGCERGIVTDAEQMRQWLAALVQAIDMKAHGEPLIEHFGSADLQGITALQLIETSSITAHANDCDGSLYLNVFSCKPFAPDPVIANIEQLLKPAILHAKYLSRKAGIGPRELAVWSTGREPATV